MGKSRELTEDNFDSVLASSKTLFLLDFWNDSCVVCKRVTPMLENLAERYEGQLVLAKINADNNPKIVERFAIRGLPTLIFIKNGKVLNTLTGVKTRSELTEIIEDNM